MKARLKNLIISILGALLIVIGIVQNVINNITIFQMVIFIIVGASLMFLKPADFATIGRKLLDQVAGRDIK